MLLSRADSALLPGVVEAASRLRGDGFLLVMVTNQPDVSRGLARREDVEAANSKLAGSLGLASVEVCFHDDADCCDCRKPLPGMLFRSAARHGVDLGSSFVVGDRWRDIEAGKAAGCRTVMVDGLDEGHPVSPDHRAPSLLAAARWIVSSRGPDTAGEGSAL